MCHRGGRGAAVQWNKEDKYALDWTRLSWLLILARLCSGLISATPGSAGSGSRCSLAPGAGFADDLPDFRFEKRVDIRGLHHYRRISSPTPTANGDDIFVGSHQPSVNRHD